MCSNRLPRYAEELDLRGIAVGHDAAFDIARAARHVREP
jgi:hypothetical protein